MVNPRDLPTKSPEIYKNPRDVDLGEDGGEDDGKNELKKEIGKGEKI